MLVLGSVIQQKQALQITAYFNYLKGNFILQIDKIKKTRIY